MRDASGGSDMAQGDKLVVTGDAVNLRAGPTTSSAVLGTFKKGTLATETSREGDWVEVVVGGDAPLSGFLAGPYLAPAPAPTATPTSGGDYLSKVTVDQVVPMFPATPRANIQT